MNHFKKIFLVSFLLLQVFSYLHLSEHGQGGKHEHNEACDFVFHLNHFSADDSVDVAIQLPEFEKEIFALSEFESQVSQLNAKSYLSRAPPQIS